MLPCVWHLHSVSTVCFHAHIPYNDPHRLVSAIPAAKDESTSSVTESSTHASSSPSSTPGNDAQETVPVGRKPGQDGSDDATQTDLPDRRPTSTSDGTKASTTSKHSIIIAPTAHRTHPHSSWTGTPGVPFTHHFPPPPGATPPPRPPQPPPPPTSKGQPPIAIAFEVIGGVVALIVLVGLARCYIVWRRTPPRDRIAALMSRHRLEREMEEMERERMERLSQALEARRWRPPPPPYQPPPPDYEAVNRAESPPG